MVVEDGNGLINSNSYVDLDFADNYFSVRGNETWANLEEEKKCISLVKATDYIDSAFDWNGIKATYEQALMFPRKKLIDNNGYEVTGIPKNLKEAVCECALKIGQNTEMFQTEDSNGAVTSEHIGELSFSYDVSRKTKDKTLYEAINLRLRGLFKDKASQKIVMGEYSVGEFRK